MPDISQSLQNISTSKTGILDPAIPLDKYVVVDLSVENPDLLACDIRIPDKCQEYISSVLYKQSGQVAYGGYLEKRYLYSDLNLFEATASPRDIHLGVDFWAPAKTTVHAPLAGIVHSLADNVGKGNYGPTIILAHAINGSQFYTLYGHLDHASLEKHRENDLISPGEHIGSLGDAAVNGGYAPHLHFQIVLDLENYKGDYPGVCDLASLDYYKNNCPDPAFLLKFIAKKSD